MIYLTGDTHGNFKRVRQFCERIGTTKDDILIVLGDAGINYSVNDAERSHKHKLQNLPITLLCLHGNHERRPESLTGMYTKSEWNGGEVYLQYDFPSLMFAVDGAVYNLDGNKAIAIGGAYSVDKFYRLDSGYAWFDDEQPDKRIKKQVETVLSDIGWKVDFVLSHTCPYKYIPRECFLGGIDQSTVDNGTERWLGRLEKKMDYKKWYCGHFHTSKVIDKMRFMFEDFIELGH